MQTYSGKRPTFKQVFQEVLRLSQKDQRRLKDELSKLSAVKLLRPVKTNLSAGRKMADEVRQELAAGSEQSLDDAMREMRGRLWL